MTLRQFNQYNSNMATAELLKCCGSSKWAEMLVSQIPFNTLDDLKRASDKAWFSCNAADWLEAFSHHPRIGAVKSLEKKFASKTDWPSGEQAGVNDASGAILEELAVGNVRYEKKFGFIFIVCASGKSAGEMLELLKYRLGNGPEEEIKIAMEEQNKITHLRLDKLFS